MEDENVTGCIRFELGLFFDTLFGLITKIKVKKKKKGFWTYLKINNKKIIKEKDKNKEKRLKLIKT